MKIYTLYLNINKIFSVTRTFVYVKLPEKLFYSNKELVKTRKKYNDWFR